MGRTDDVFAFEPLGLVIFHTDHKTEHDNSCGEHVRRAQLPEAEQHAFLSRIPIRPRETSLAVGRLSALMK